MPDPLWPENGQTVCAVDSRDTAHRSITCERFHRAPDDDRATSFTTTALARAKNKTPCLCLRVVWP